MKVNTAELEVSNSKKLLQQRRMNFACKIITASSDVEKEMINYMVNFPKRERNFLVKYIRDEFNGFHRSIIKAEKSDKPKSSLYEAYTIFEMLILHIRSSFTLTYLSYNHYQNISVKTVEIRKEVDRWIRMETTA